MPSSSFGFGIVGTGLIAGFHARAIAETAGAHLVGVVGRSREKAQAFAREQGAVFATDQVEHLAARDDVQVICVATPSGAHLAPALAAIRAGKHVVVEKPLEITLERADQILRAAAAAGVRVAPIFQARFGPGARALQAAVTAGRFGRLALCSAYVKWHRAPEYYAGSWHGTRALDGGGALMNQGIHAVDLLQWLAGLPVEVFGWSSRCRHAGIEVEDTASAALRFAGGALGVIEASTAVWPGWQRRLEICGTEGSAVLEDDHLARWDFRPGAPEDDGIRTGRVDERMRSGAAAPQAISHHGHQQQIEDLVRALRTDGPLAIEGGQARNAIALIRAIYASAEQGSPVAL